MLRKISVTACFAAGALVLPQAGHAATIDSWNTGNVVVGAPDANDADDVGGASVIYDQDVSGGVPAGAVSSGQIVYIAPESNTPGLKVVQEAYDVFDGCLMASSTATCTSGFQSGKRIKQQVTKPGTIDLSFNVSADGQGEAIYEVYHRLINVTGGTLSDFTIELGTGIGAGFSGSGSGDGLRFATTGDGATFGPDNVAAFSQYPYGLFGGNPPNPNPLNLPGFFDTTDRAGMNVILAEDSITSDGYYGTYDDRFGGWMDRGAVPEGLLYDYDPGNADPLVMAWANATGWEFLRGIDLLDPAPLNPLGVEPIASVFFGYDWVYDPVNGISAAMQAYMTANLLDGAGALDFGSDLVVAPIEDLANLNLTFAIAVDDSFASQNSSFTLRVTTATAPVPLPAAGWMLLAGVGAIGALRRRS